MPASARDHEAALAARGVRKELGAYYTPADVVSGLLDLVLDPLLAVRSADGPGAVAAIRILDPACGTGNFLVPAARRIAARLVALGTDPDEAQRLGVRCVRGIELDDATARRCRAALKALHVTGGGRTVVRGDALLDDVLPVAGFDLVVGNPPFLSQLSSSTARTRDDAARLRARFGSAVGPYTDPAAVFLLAALRATRPGGTVALIEPVAVLSTRDARGVRDAALHDAGLAALWIAGEPVFDAEVEVCAPVLVRRGDAPTPVSAPATTRLVRGRAFLDGPVVASPSVEAGSWSALLAALGGLPFRAIRSSGVLGDIASATADFRDQYYGLAGAVVDTVADAVAGDGADDDGVAGGGRGGGGWRWPRLVTSGLIDPAALLWGERPCRFNKATYQHPRVDVDRLEPALADWAARRLVPKVLVATQTRVLEAVVDEDGELLPSVPVVTVTARSGHRSDLWRIGALLCSPVVALVAAQRHLGTGRNATALRLSASDLLALPLPVDRGAWDQAAEAFADASRSPDARQRRARLRASATAMDTAFGLDPDEALVAWWESRLPKDGIVRAKQQIRPVSPP